MRIVHCRRLSLQGIAMLLWAVSCCLPCSPSAAQKPLQIDVGSTPGNLVYLQLDLAQSLQYFKEAGLKVRVRPFNRSADAAAALEHGQVDFSANSMDHAITSSLSGSHLKMIASFTDLPTVTLVIRRDLRSQIRTLRDLKGRRIGITSYGSGRHVLLMSALKSAGLSAADVKLITVGTGDALIESVRSKRIDAVITTDPVTIRLLLNGDASLLLDMVTYEETQRVFHGGYQFTGLLTRQDVIDKRPDIVQKMVDVIVRVDRFIATHSAAEIAAVLPPAIVGDRYIYIKSLEHSRPAFSSNGLVTSEAVANSIQSLVTFGAISSNQHLDPATYYDMTFVNRSSAR